MNYIAEHIQHVILKTEPWRLIDMAPGQHLSTKHEVTIYADRAQAIQAIKEQYPEFEPDEWSYDPTPRIKWLQQQLLDTDYVGLADYDRDRPDIKAKRQSWREEIRRLKEIINE